MIKETIPILFSSASAVCHMTPDVAGDFWFGLNEAN
jgi:hypothetical protein